jgi:hypothetical protein
MMKTVTIEELLTWAFVHELPKGGGVDGLANMNSAWRMLQASSWGKISAYAELMTLVDIDRGGGGNFFIDQGEPHEDALAVGEAVAALGHCDVMFPEGWNPLADWPDDDGLVMPAVGRTVERYMLRPSLRRAANIVSTVIGCAVLGRAPDWASEPSKVRMVERAGRPAWFVKRVMRDSLGRDYEVETNGYNGRTHRPVRGAYRKYEFSTDPAGDILSRLDWQLWVLALRHVAEKVRPKLAEHSLLPCEEIVAPWIGSDRGGVWLIEPKEKVAADRKKSTAAC